MIQQTTPFETNLKQAFSESCYELALQNRENSKEYQSLQHEHDTLFDRITDVLGEEGKQMLRLEELQNQLQSIDNEHIYLQGFIDCACLLKLIRII